MATFVAGVTGVDFDLLDLGPLAAAGGAGSTATSIELRASGVVTQIFGTGFQFAASGPPTAGTINRIVVATPQHLEYSDWLGPWQHKVEVIPFGLDLDRFAATPTNRFTVHG